MAPGGGGPVADPDSYIFDKAAPLAAWFNRSDPPAMFPVNASLDWLKAAPINASGHYSDPVAHVHDYAPHIAGMGGSNMQPDILCLALSWETAVAIRRGVYASHGRIYPPNYAQPLVAPSYMRVTATEQAGWVTHAKLLLTILSADPSPAVPIVASGHGGEFQPITGVRVGDVLDVQRRRKDALKESYAAALFP
jgi:hypothetical protein